MKAAPPLGRCPSNPQRPSPPRLHRPLAGRTLSDRDGTVVRTAAERAAAIAHRVTGEREARGWTRQTLAKQAGVSPQTVSNVEDGESYPDLVTVCAFADVLNIDSAELLAARVPAANG